MSALAGRVAMISGASRGIGAAVARNLSDAGWTVSLGMRRPGDAPSDLRGGAFFYDALNVASEAAWMQQTIVQFGGLDGLVLNAGIHSQTDIINAQEDEFDRLIAVNVKSPLRLAQLAWPHLAAARPDPGRIVLMSSLSGKRVKSAASGLYGLSKFALMGLAQGLRQSGKENRIRTTAICPSFVATDMAAGVMAETAHLTQPEDLAVIVRTVLELPPSASIADIPVHWSVEDCF